jgi:hypothetical protein
METETQPILLPTDQTVSEVIMNPVKCPQCRKEMSKQGLSGHMRFVHGVNMPKLEAPPKTVKTTMTVPSVSVEVNFMIMELDEIRERKKTLEAKTKLFGDETVDELLAVLKAQEKKLLGRIRELKARLTKP